MQVLLLFHLSYPPLPWEHGGAPANTAPLPPPHTHQWARSNPPDTEYKQATPKAEHKNQRLVHIYGHFHLGLHEV